MKFIQNVSSKAVYVVFVLFVISFLSIPFCAIAQEDTTPPVLLEFDFAPKTIDVGTTTQSVTATLRITDDLSGSSQPYVRFISPSGQQDSYAWGDVVSGPPQDRIYDAILTFPAFSETGTWRISDIYLSDAVGNEISYSESDLIALGFPTELEVSAGLTIDDILNFFDESVSDGTIYGKGVIPFIAKIRLYAFGQSLEYAKSFIEEGNIAGACNQLEEVSRKCDGEQLPPDWILGEAVPEIYDIIFDLIEELGC